MPRLRQVPRREIHERGRPIYDMLFGDRCPVSEPGTETGSPGNWWTVFAGVPDCFDHAVQGFAFYRSPKRKIDPKLRELGQIRAGYARGSRFVFSQHCKASREVGLSEEQIQAIVNGSCVRCSRPASASVPRVLPRACRGAATRASPHAVTSPSRD